MAVGNGSERSSCPWPLGSIDERDRIRSGTAVVALDHWLDIEPGDISETREIHSGTAAQFPIYALGDGS